MGDLFDGYGAASTATRRGAKAFDEMFADDATTRSSYKEIHAALAQMTQDELRGRTDSLASSYLAQGVTFDFAGEERPFPLDAVPRVIDQEEWLRVEAGVKQRVLALEAFLADMYGPQNAVRDGVIPAALISSSNHFHRQAAGIDPANGVRIHVSGIDLIRDEAGAWRVLEDNVRVPSGLSYVISNRRVMAQTLPELFVSMRVRPVGDYPHKLLHALRASAPRGIEDPTIVVLTPGVYNSAYFEHTLLARLMGVELVEGRDLFCSGGRVWMRTTSGPTRVDVIYRRVDDEFLDPLQFRADSMLGSPGLLLAARLGNVTIANAIGNGVADDKLVYTYLPELIRYYLSENPVLPNVDTWRLEEPAALEEVLDRLDELVVKPVDGSGGKGLVVGPDASPDELAKLRRRLLADPRGWIAQPVVQLSTIPTLVQDGMRARHADLRPFAVHDGTDVWVLPGGLTRVALPEGQLVVNSSQGGGSKDTWVVGDDQLQVSRHSIQHLVAGQAAVTESITIITPEMLDQDHSPLDRPQDHGQQEQQQQGSTTPRWLSRTERSEATFRWLSRTERSEARIETGSAAGGFDTAAPSSRPTQPVEDGDTRWLSMTTEERPPVSKPATRAGFDTRPPASAATQPAELRWLSGTERSDALGPRRRGASDVAKRRSGEAVGSETDSAVGGFDTAAPSSRPTQPAEDGETRWLSRTTAERPPVSKPPARAGFDTRPPASAATQPAEPRWLSRTERSEARIETGSAAEGFDTVAVRDGAEPC